MTKNYIHDLKSEYLRKKLRITKGEMYFNKFEKGKILKKGLDLMEATFCFKPVNWNNYNRKLFFSS